MRAALITAWTAAWALSACGSDEAPGPTLRVVIAQPDGSSPLEGHDHIAVRLTQGDSPVQVLEDEVTAAGFDLALVLQDRSVPITLSVELTGPGGAVIGAPPTFFPFETDLVAIPVGAPDSCATVGAMTLPSARAALGVAQHRTFALVIGGDDADGPSDFAGFLDLLQLAADSFDDLPVPIGRSTAIPLDDVESIVLSTASDPFVYDVTSAELPMRTLALHAGAGAGSTGLSLGPEGVVVIGGGTADVPVGGVSWIAADRTIRTTRLAAPRFAPAAVALGARVLVVGGAASPTAPWAELVAASMDVGAPLDSYDDGVRRGAGLFASADGATAVLVGGVDETGAPRSDTLAITGCPACAVAAGPAWGDPRPGAVPVRDPAGGLLVGGAGPSPAVDRVSIPSEGPPEIRPIGPLSAPRADAAVLVLPSGIAFVVGGTGPDGPRQDVEVCFPPTIEIP